MDTFIHKYDTAGSHGGTVGHALKASISNTSHSGSFCSICGAWRGAFGLEPTISLYIDHSLEILREVKRVLRKDGVVWWNIGDSYASGKGTCFNPGGGKGSFSSHGDRKDAGVYPLDRGNVSMLRLDGLKPKDLCLIPERLAIACQEDGWWVRSIPIWNKANPMPESMNGWRWERHRIKIKTAQRPRQVGHHSQGREIKVPIGQQPQTEWQDCPGCPKCNQNDGYVLRKGSWRPTDSYEHILMLIKSSSYYCDAEAVREVYTGPLNRWGGPKLRKETGKTSAYKDEILKLSPTSAMRAGNLIRPNPNGRNLRNVWSFPTIPYPGAHFAVFPEKLPELCIRAATPEIGVCSKCGAPWARVLHREVLPPPDRQHNKPFKHAPETTHGEGLATLRNIVDKETIDWRPTCKCGTDVRVPATVLDNFAGAGTTLKVAIKLGRNAIGYELSSEYCRLIEERMKYIQLKTL